MRRFAAGDGPPGPRRPTGPTRPSRPGDARRPDAVTGAPACLGALMLTRFDGARSGGIPTAYVDADGRFRFEIPIDGVASASGASSATLDNGAMTLIYPGRLGDDRTRGRYTVGMAEFG